MTKMDIKEFYTKILPELEEIAISLCDDLVNHFKNQQRIDRISARAKSLESFLCKAEKLEGGQLKYDDPLTQIQDLIGVRIVTFYKSDVQAISNLLKKYYSQIEEKLIVPDNESEFGYEGKHFIMFIPEDFLLEKKTDELPKFFELQIKTLYQHAWSEANHDLGYKSEKRLSTKDKRKLAFASAQSWGADEMFSDLSTSLIESPTS